MDCYELSSNLPFDTSHLGDSGINTNPMNCRTAGTPARPSMYLQPTGCFENAPQTQAAVNWPKVMTRTVVLTRRPRTLGGAASLM